MAIYTPRGLKIRLPLDYAFALMARLYPKYHAFKILQTAEAIELMPKALAAIAGIICFLLHLNWLTIAIVTFLAAGLAHILDNIGWLLKSLIKVCIIYSYVSGYGILLIGIVILGFFTVGWKGVAAFLAAKLIMGLIAGLLDFQKSVKLGEKMDLAMTASERHFFHAYRLYAYEIGEKLDLSVEEKELEENNWQPVLYDLATNWPEVVARFTTE